MKHIKTLLLIFTTLSFILIAFADDIESFKISIFTSNNISETIVMSEGKEFDDIPKFIYSKHREQQLNLYDVQRFRSVEPISADMISKKDRVILNLFDDVQYQAVVKNITTNVRGTTTVRAAIEGLENGLFVLSTTADRTLGVVKIPEKGEFYLIKSDLDTGKHYLLDIGYENQNYLESSPSLSLPIDTPRLKRNDNRNSFEMRNNGPDDLAVINVMIVYTPASELWAETEGGGIDNVIANTMETAQIVHDNSGTLVELNLVNASLIDYVESGDSTTDLFRLTFREDWDPVGYEDGPPWYMEEVHDWRDGYGADLVSMLAFVNDTGGLAWQLNNEEGFPELGFSLVRVQQSASSYTFVHELGHNMGCHHHKEQSVQPGPGLFDYSAGWRWIGMDDFPYCSIMTYESGSYYTDRRTHYRVPVFSTPTRTVQGVLAGDEVDGDNTRTIREVKHIIAAYRGEPYFAGGKGSEQEPWQVATAEHLNNVRFYLGADHNDKHFVQITNIDLDVYPWNDDLGWEPIGNSFQNSFRGSYNGNGNTINGLFIDRYDSDYQGLFGYTADAVLTGIGIINAAILGKSNVGSLVGYSGSNSTIINCFGVGSVSGNISVGGLVGNNQHGSIIEKSFSKGSVYGRLRVGGLAGENWTGSTILQSYTTSDVTAVDIYGLGENYALIGGLTGNNNQSYIQNCYSMGNVTVKLGAHDTFGGLAGFNYQGEIINSYSLGTLVYTNTTNPTNKGFCGGVTTGGIYKMTGNYWDKDTSNQLTTSGSASGKTTTQMVQQETFTGWLFNDIWMIEESNSYPYLKWQDNLDHNILRRSVPNVAQNMYQTTFNDITVTFFAKEDDEGTADVSMEYTTSTEHSSVKLFPSPENLGAYYRFIFDDSETLYNGLSFQVRFSAEPNQLWYKHNEPNWKNIPLNNIIGPEAPDFTYTISIDGLLTVRRDENTVIEFAGDNGGQGQTLPIELSSFTYSINEGSFVTIKWVSETESNLLGYNLLRGYENKPADAIIINRQIIPASNSSKASYYNYDDVDIEVGTKYYYWLQIVELDLTDSIFGPIALTIEEQVEDEEDVPSLELVTELKQNYPNPFNPYTIIQYSLAEDTEFMELNVYNILGQLVRSLYSGSREKGVHTIHWDGIDDNGRALTSGIYFYRLQTERYNKINKMLMIK